MPYWHANFKMQIFHEECDQAENVLRTRTPRTWWAVARTGTAVVVSHIWRGREPILCALIVQRAACGA